MVSPDAFLNLCHEINQKNSRDVARVLLVFRPSSLTTAIMQVPFHQAQMGGMLSSDQKAGIFWGGHRWGLLRSLGGSPQWAIHFWFLLDAPFEMDQALYFLGIIDILTPYDGRKHLEHWFKAPVYQSSNLECFWWLVMCSKTILCGGRRCVMIARVYLAALQRCMLSASTNSWKMQLLEGNHHCTAVSLYQRNTLVSAMLFHLISGPFIGFLSEHDWWIQAKILMSLTVWKHSLGSMKLHKLMPCATFGTVTRVQSFSVLFVPGFPMMEVILELQSLLR